MELLMGFLRNPKCRLRLVIKLLEDYILPLQDTVDWGPSLPCNIRGQMNLHPRAAMEWRAGDEAEHIVKFYDKILSDI